MRALLTATWVVYLVTTATEIIFPWLEPPCDGVLDEFEGCHREQNCLLDNTCFSVQQGTARRDTAPRDDGRCGKDFNGAPCDPSGPYGGCCSAYGWCGATTDYCLTSDGCQSGCTDSTISIMSATNTLTEPVLGSPTSAPLSAPTGSVTTDGTCGAANGNSVCGDWSLGSCCSMYGFCGNTAAHCGEGCQSGPCNQASVPLAPGPSPAPASSNPGVFEIVGDSGVPAMHAALMPNGEVVFLDKLENFTHLTLSNGQYAYSAEYDVESNKAVPLAYKTNAFCAGGSFLPDGTLVSLGGNGPLSWLDPTIGDGFDGIRYLTRSSSDASLNGNDWSEPGNKLASDRWYPSVQTMPDGTLFVASGSLNGLDPTVLANNNPTYEVLDAGGVSRGESIPMALLVKTQPYFMYPFIHLLRDGTLFVFVSKSSEIFDVATNTARKTLPDLPGDYRTYPNTGGSVLLPLSSTQNWNPDILICGGGAYQDITSPTDASCGRIKPLDANPLWEMDSMPEGRGMVEGTLLPDGTVVWLNGCQRGAQGFQLAQDPALEVLIYNPAAALGKRWTTGASSTIPRLYHSVALLLLDGTLLVAGSNPVEMPVEQPTAAIPYVTEWRVEIYTPPYLSGDNAFRRPQDIKLSLKDLTVGSTQIFGISFIAPPNAKTVRVALYHGGFVTHSVHMSHRMLFLDATGFVPDGTVQQLTVQMPPDANIAPPGPYVVYVVLDGVPGVGQFVMVR